MVSLVRTQAYPGSERLASPSEAREDLVSSSFRGFLRFPVS